MVKTLEALRNDLVEREMLYRGLDLYMVNNGYYSVLGDNLTKQFKGCKVICYTSTDTNICEIHIDFEIVHDSGEDEAEESFILKVLDISRIN